TEVQLIRTAAAGGATPVGDGEAGTRRPGNAGTVAEMDHAGAAPQINDGIGAEIERSHRLVVTTRSKRAARHGEVNAVADAIVVSFLQRSGVEREGAGEGVGGAERNLARAVFGQPTGATDDAADGRVTGPGEGESVTGVGDVAADGQRPGIGADGGRGSL